MYFIYYAQHNLWTQWCICSILEQVSQIHCNHSHTIPTSSLLSISCPKSVPALFLHSHLTLYWANLCIHHRRCPIDHIQTLCITFRHAALSHLYQLAVKFNEWNMFCPPTLNHITHFSENQVSNIVASAQQLINDNLYLLSKTTIYWNQQSSTVLHFSYYDHFKA